MEFAKTMIFAIAAIGFFVWVGMIWQAKGEEKLAEACHPVSFTTEKFQNISTALVGYVPNWTVSFRKFMDGGCYYFFSILLQPGDSDSTTISGGVRK